MIIVGRHINNISLNELEYLLDEEGEIMQFESESNAIDFLKEKGFTDKDLYWLVFEEVEEQNEKN